jgi:Putative DNA-binding domain
VPVAISIDTSSALRAPHELAQLVSAIVAASPNDETDWLEWKSGMALGQKETQVTIARHILGMANRRVADARRQVGGCGHIVIGVEPGSLSGVTEVDPADLDQAVQAYLGSGGPSWSAAYVGSGEASVLVITVEPPTEGDRIRTLQRQYQPYLAGAIFVRRQGRTVPALPDDVEALEDRFAEPLRRAERERQRWRLEKIGKVVEELFAEVIDADANQVELVVHMVTRAQWSGRWWRGSR